VLSVETELFRKGMRHLAGAVTIVATSHEGRRGGLTATAVCSLSAEPPRVLACVNLRGTTFGMIAQSRKMSVNVLARHHETLARRFAKMEGDPGESPFVDEHWEQAVTGSPVLSDATVAFDCLVDEMLVAHSHAILIGEVKAIRLNPGAAPLVYLDGCFTSVVSPEAG